MKQRLYSLVATLGLAWTFAYMPAAHATEPADDDPPAIELPSQELTPETLFLLLLAEIAGARGEIGVSVDAYIQLARQTRDPRIAKRATEIALFSRDMNAAAAAARVWADTEPESEEARRVLAGVLANGGERLNEVQIQLARILAGSREQLEQNLLGLNRALARVPDKQTVRAIVDRLAEPYMSEPAAHFARAQAAAGAEDGIGALAAIEEALRLRPDWDLAVSFKAQLLVQLDATRDALDLLSAHLAKHPDSRNVRLVYARTLVTIQNFEAALVEFRRLLGASPDDRDLMYAVALVSLQLDDLDNAHAYFERALAADHPEADGIRINLGQIAEQLDRPDDALHWYREVDEGRHYYDAQERIAAVLAAQGDLAGARLHLNAVKAGPEDRRRLMYVEVLLLRNANEYEEALRLIDAALRDEPEDANLLYESAMLAERLDRLGIMEERLRKLIDLDPGHAHAYNALGYSLADRGLRLDEAEALIERALELAPDDPFILDSMGWVRFKQSDLEGALDHLERAYTIRPDPEIAAHLGEVLWKLDRQEDADEVWNDALREHPDNAILNDTVNRLRAQ